jgi:hypothetical protein
MDKGGEPSVNTLYDIARRRMLSSQLDWSTLPVRMLAFTAQYDFDPTHQTVADLGVASVAESELFVGQHVTPSGFAASDNAWFQNVPLSPPWLFLVIVDDANSLIAFYDEGINLPRTPNGQDEVVIPDWLSERGWFRP